MENFTKTRKKQTSISIIITTIKSKKDIKTLESLKSCPVKYQLIISTKSGIGYARNYGAKQAKEKLLVFLDDDLILKDEIWKHILSIKRGEFGMTSTYGFPCARVMVIHKSDFWKIGGFNNKIRFTGEDRDFYMRALEKGLKFKKIPINLVIHEEHEKSRHRNIYTRIDATKENVLFIIKYLGKCPKILKTDFLDRFKKLQIRTLLLQLFFLFYYLIKLKNKNTY